ncbi:hypothetical protein ZIOFF_022888 [Zingiber officinale]|uniref:Uncharacterized protein n=1 Tax=Zingiber officinale TaxID=94328 RepID=A0A8J5LHP8_ZINOF|nr:hypothetical protein ZIOFF_022888 [Zingiber officinale]
MRGLHAATEGLARGLRASAGPCAEPVSIYVVLIVGQKDILLVSPGLTDLPALAQARYVASGHLFATFCSRYWCFLVEQMHHEELDFFLSFFPGKMQKPLTDLLKEYDLPIGLFPQDATHYEFNEETRKLTVFIPEVCEVGYRDSSVLRFSTTVTGYLEKGKLSDIEGIKTKVLIWAKVTCLSTEGSKIHFTTGVKKTRSRSAYEVLRGGIVVDKF